MNAAQSSEISAQQVTTIISGLIALASAIVTSYMAMRQKKKEKEGQLEVSDREQNRELVKNLQESDKKKQIKIDEMDLKIHELYENYESLLKENMEVRSKLAAYEIQKESWQRERETWQTERESWQTERKQHDLEKKNWELEKQGWHNERRELTSKIKNLETQVQELEFRINGRQNGTSQGNG